MKPRTLLALALSCAVSASVATAGPGESAPPSGGSDPPVLRRTDRDASGDVATAQRTPPPTVLLEGRVVDSSGRPQRGVTIKLFANGVMAGSTISEPDGSFRLSGAPMQGAKSTAVVWFQSPEPDLYLDASIVLWAGTSAKQHGLFPACTQFADGTQGVAKVEVTLRSVDERKTVIAASKCLAGGA